MRGLSAKAIASQEHILQEYAQLFAAGIRREIGDKPGKLEISKWFSLATFDVIGDLAFGKSFEGLKTGKVHGWIKVVFSAFKALPILRVIREIPGALNLGNFALYFLPRTLKQEYLDHFEYAFGLVEKRMENPKERPDMLYYLMDSVGKGLTRDEIKENAAQTVMAGSEPVSRQQSRGETCQLMCSCDAWQTATFLTGLVYYIGLNEEVHEKLKTEIRSAFSCSTEISTARLAQLEYLKLTVREGLRIFPPAADIFPRIIPAGGKEIFGKRLPEGVRCFQYNSSNMPALF